MSLGSLHGKLLELPTNHARGAGRQQYLLSKPLSAQNIASLPAYPPGHINPKPDSELPRPHLWLKRHTLTPTKCRLLKRCSRRTTHVPLLDKLSRRKYECSYCISTIYTPNLGKQSEAMMKDLEHSGHSPFSVAAAVQAPPSARSSDRDT